MIWNAASAAAGAAIGGLAFALPGFAGFGYLITFMVTIRTMESEQS